MSDSVLVARFGNREIARAPERDTLTVEDSVYFPPDSVDFGCLEESRIRTRCPWRGEAVYYDIRDGDRVLEAAAWCYRRPRKKAARLAGHVSFWKEVVVESL